MASSRASADGLSEGKLDSPQSVIAPQQVLVSYSALPFYVYFLFAKFYVSESQDGATVLCAIQEAQAAD